MSRRFGRQQALDDVSLHVRRGDCYGFIGHNGAGKTTALRILLGLIRPHAGRVLVDGFDARRHVREARARMGGLIEVPGFHAGWSGARNLVALAQLAGHRRADARRRCDRLLELVGLDHVGSKPVRAYSQGMRQRLGLAQALLDDPRYVLLDEPTNGLDPEGIADLRRVLTRVREDGATVLLSSHQLGEVSEICNRVGIIRQGRMVIESAVDELLGGTHRLYRLEVARPDAANAALSGLGLESTVGTDGALRVDLGERTPDDVAAALGAAGCGMRTFSPQRPTLEEVYLHGEPDRSADAADAPSAAATPGERLACGAPTRRILRYDTGRWSNMRIGLLLAAPAALGAVGVYERVGQHTAAEAELEAGSLASTTDVTAFEAIGHGLQFGLPLLTFVAIGLASQSISGELSQGTLRNVLLRPLTRAHVALGKALSTLAAVAIGYVILWGATLGASVWAFDFKDVVEILPNGEAYVYVETDELWTYVWPLIHEPLAPLAAYAGLGFLFGALVRRGTSALVITLLLAVFLDVVRALARTWRFEEYLPSAYLPSFLGDTSYVRYYLDASTGAANASFPYADTSLQYPCVIAVVSFLLAGVALTRRSVP